VRSGIAKLDGLAFDVAVVGGGINGASAAQHLAAAGYTVLLVDKGDFASGSTGRSSRILHCGLRYLAPGASIWEFARHPSRLAVALRMARQAMVARAHIVATTPQRVVATRCHFPIWSDGPYPAWQVDAAFRGLSVLGGGKLPLDYQRLNLAQSAQTPLVSALRDRTRLVGVAAYREYLFDWPERLCLDAVLDAERLGATVRNYTEATAITRMAEGWRLVLDDRVEPGQRATVQARVVLNMAGIWIDRVTGTTGRSAGRRITGTKGAHIVVRLPEECQGHAIATLNRNLEPFYCLPWRGLHYFGPTETLYDGDPDDIRVTDHEIDGLLAEANHLLPALKLKRDDVLQTWAGVRPLTYDPAQPKGNRSRVLHDLVGDGLQDMLALTAGPIMTHRSAGSEILRELARRFPPSRSPQSLSYAGSGPSRPASDTGPDLAYLRHAAEHEHVVTLIDLLVRRTGDALGPTMAVELAEQAAHEIKGVLGWGDLTAAEEVRQFRTYLDHFHHFERNEHPGEPIAIETPVATTTQGATR